MEDIIIIGAGPAGLSAALYTTRYNLKTLIISGDVGGQTAISGKIENYPGFNSGNSFELIQIMKSQAESFGAIIKTGENTQSVKKTSEGFTVTTDKGEYKSKAVIIAMGKSSRKLNVPGEKELTGRGVSYCATCDGMFAKDKDVVIVGSGFAATEAVLDLAKLAKSITVISKAPGWSGENITIEKIKNLGIDDYFNADILKFQADENGILESVEFKINEKGKTVKCNFAFIEIGYIPNTAIFKDALEINEYGEIVIDPNNNTSVRGIFAAGDITDVCAKQSIVAAGEGAKAAINANKYLQNLEK